MPTFLLNGEHQTRLENILLVTNFLAMTEKLQPMKTFTEQLPAKVEIQFCEGTKADLKIWMKPDGDFANANELNLPTL